MAPHGTSAKGSQQAPDGDDAKISVEPTSSYPEVIVLEKTADRVIKRMSGRLVKEEVPDTRRCVPALKDDDLYYLIMASPDRSPINVPGGSVLVRIIEAAKFHDSLTAYGLTD